MISQMAPDDGLFVVHNFGYLGRQINSVHVSIRNAVAASEAWEEIGFLRWGGGPNDIEAVEPVTPPGHDPPS